ncbi:MULTISPECIES: Tex family protein [unclassified Carboxydocella]|uniref:Tex family protein n=2 Tax=Carboxydocella TaxID=178898 RepID=UPI0009AC53C8|nr:MULTISPECIES: Tex family protein [unclassified Carboxydocella]
MVFANLIAAELGLKPWQVENTIKLLDEENTVPFIARYRKEATGELDENQIRMIAERVNYLRNLEKRKEDVIRHIAELEQLTPELEAAIRQATRLSEVEDLYRPYRPKRRTRATVAREKGLEPLARILWAQDPAAGSPIVAAQAFVNPDLGVESAEAALAGALDILAEEVSDQAEYRQYLREYTRRHGYIKAKKVKEGITPFDMYSDYQEPLKSIPPHRVLAINRGEKEEVLKVDIAVEEGPFLAWLRGQIIKDSASPFAEVLTEMLNDSYKRLLAPSIERELRQELTEKAEEQAIKVFGANLKQLLLQPPVRNVKVLGIDPGYRTGCKLAVVDETGKVVAIGVIYPHPPQSQEAEARAELARLVQDHGVDLIAIGNGTASRETEQVVAAAIREYSLPVQYCIVSEAGASVYSASKLAAEEFPDFDLTQRSAVSIARRLQDPLAELVKIEPKSIGVGQYQHDVNPKRLEEVLGQVVESAVNSVGVDLNTASFALLQYVAGIKTNVAKNIVAYREQHGKFRTRAELLKVPRLGQATFVQCAGFLRLPDGDNPLENTPVHPESYGLAEQILARIGFQPADLRQPERLKALSQALAQLDPQQVAAELGAGVPTVRDIFEALQKPGRDPREDLPKPIFRQDVTSLDNLQEGMILTGTVRNIVDFGVFVDIGVKQDGLIHISRLTSRYIKHPLEVVKVGDILKVKVISIDRERGRIGLSLRDVEQ